LRPSRGLLPAALRAKQLQPHPLLPPLSLTATRPIMSFLQLPAELQIHVFSYSAAPELKAARAVCTKFRDNASMWLFRKVLACARYQAMGAFQRISEHTTYGKYVKEIVFDGTTYDPDLAQSEYLYQRSADQFEQLKGVVSWARRTR